MLPFNKTQKRCLTVLCIIRFYSFTKTTISGKNTFKWIFIYLKYISSISLVISSYVQVLVTKTSTKVFNGKFTVLDL